MSLPLPSGGLVGSDPLLDLVGEDGSALLHDVPETRDVRLVGAFHSLEGAGHPILCGDCRLRVASADPRIAVGAVHDPVAQEVQPSLCQRVRTVRPSADIVRVMIVLAIVLPVAQAADVVPTPFRKCRVTAARARDAVRVLCAGPTHRAPEYRTDNDAHLCRVAGITSHQMRRLADAGIGTLTALAQSTAERIPKMDDTVLRRLQRQAFLQLESKGKGDELPRLQARHATAMRFFVRVKDKDDLDLCVAVLKPEDVRSEFDTAFKRFSESLDMMLPDPHALPYANDARWLGKIRATAAARYRDDKLDISDCGAKVRKVIEEAVIAEGIQILVKQVSLFTPEFEDRLKSLKTEDARASEMEHAIRHEIHVKLDENPAFFVSLRERLEQIIEDRKAKRIDAAQQLKLFEAIKSELRGHADAAEKLGLTETGFAIYGLLRAGEPMRKDDEAKTALASVLEEQLEPHVTIVDWTTKDDVQREMRRLIKRQLRAASVPADRIDASAESIVDLMKRRRRE